MIRGVTKFEFGSVFHIDLYFNIGIILYSSSVSKMSSTIHMNTIFDPSSTVQNNTISQKN